MLIISQDMAEGHVGLWGGWIEMSVIQTKLIYGAKFPERQGSMLELHLLLSDGEL